MKILILTGKFGMGHMKAAEAIKEELTLCREHPEQRCTSRKSDIEISIGLNIWRHSVPNTFTAAILR